MAIKLFTRKQTGSAPAVPTRKGPAPAPAPPVYEPADLVPLHENPLQRLLQLGRYGLIVAHADRWADHPEAREVLAAAGQAIDNRFALVPEGFASIPQTLADEPGAPEEDVATVPFLLDRHAVTHAEFQSFVDDGGYEDLDLWPKDIWPHLIDFVDLTGQPGPRFWRNGRHDRRHADHPVVGVCHYEAAAYTRWAGYRLPTEAEWQMAASWRIRSSAHVFRRFPWGDAMDKERCNIWVSGLGETAPVDAYKAGAAPNGVLQLIGNVWEWTASDFLVADNEGRPVVGDMMMKVIRGGAFDTYFPSQATSFFRTGLACLARSHNVGFRCALNESCSKGATA